MNTNITMKRTWKSFLRLIIILIFVLGNLQATRGNVLSTNKFVIYNGKIMYELEFSLHINDTESDIEWAIRDKITEVVTVTSISPNTVRFSSEVTIKIINAYQIVGGNKYAPESYGFEYRGADNNLLDWFDDTETHTATFIRDMSKTTGMIIRLENPMGLQYVDAIAYYDVSGGASVTRYPHMYQIALEHASMYCRIRHQFVSATIPCGELSQILPQ